MKFLNFENWSSGELSKIGHHFRKYSDFIRKCAPKFIFFNQKNIRNFRMIFDVEN